jgi:dihydroorotate dehydrogenase (NAD+) catalytic subunit
VTHAISREVFGSHFQNPIFLAAGTAGYGLELAGVMELERLGGIVCKSVSLEPRAGNRPPRVAEMPGGMRNSVGLANPGLASVVRRELPAVCSQLHRCRVLVNVVGFTLGEYAAVVRGLEAVEGLVAYELNLSCPNTSAGGLEFGMDPDAVHSIVTSARAATRRGITVKLSPALADIGAMAEIARAAGADAISVVNTLPSSLYPGDPGSARLGEGRGGVSGPALLSCGLIAVRRVREQTGLPVIATGGVRTVADVRRYLEAGATLDGIGTAALADPRLPARIVHDLEAAWPA